MISLKPSSKAWKKDRKIWKLEEELGRLKFLEVSWRPEDTRYLS